MSHLSRWGVVSSAMAFAVLIGCGGSNANDRANTPNDMGSTNQQPASVPATQQNAPPANPGTTNGGQPSTGSGTVSNPSGNEGRGGGQAP